MSKKYKDKSCVYCFVETSSTADHVFAREFFSEEQIATIAIPKVPSCRKCNNAKSSLEHYFTTLLPFGSVGQSGLINRQTKIEKRLEKNKKLHRALADGLKRNAQGDMTLPIDNNQMKALFKYIVKGLMWHHWKVILKKEHSIEIFFSTPPLEKLFLKYKQSVNEDIGNGVFCYQAAQGTDYPECSIWRFTVLNEIVLCDTNSRSSAVFAISAKKEFVEKILNLLHQPI